MENLNIASVTKMPLEAQTTIALRDSIVDGAIPAGSRLTEMRVAEQMDLSRATVRAAFNQLAKEGLLTLVPYSGWRVIKLTAHDAWELYTLRSSVERLAAQLVSKDLNEDKEHLITDIFAELCNQCQTGNVAKVSDADYAFHKAIVGLAKHSRLELQYALIEQQIRMYLRSSNALIVELSEIIEQHRPIVEAILGRDHELAGHLSEQHNLSEGEKLQTHLAKHNEHD